MRVNGKQNESTKVPSFIFVWKDKICMFWCFLPAHQPQKAPRHPHNRVVRCFRNISFRSYDNSKLSVPNNFNMILFWWGEWQSIPINSPYQKLNFFWKYFYFLPWLSLAELDVELHVLSFFLLDWKCDFFHCILSFRSSVTKYQSQIASLDHGQCSQTCKQTHQLSIGEQNIGTSLCFCQGCHG